MKFAKVVFWIAGVWGVLILTPLFFIFDSIGRNDPPPVTHPGFYYGFATVGLAFQLVFMVIASDPIRYRFVMIPAIFEKMSYVVAMIALCVQRRIPAPDMVFAAVDFLLGLLFVTAFLKTRSSAHAKN